MDHLRPRLVALAASLCCSGAWAAYASVTPPANYNAAAATYVKAANDVSFTGGIRGSAGVLNVAGKAVTMPAAYRFAANAGRIAAAASFGNPLLFAGVLAIGAAYDWYKENNYEVVDNVWKEKKFHDVPKTVICYDGNAGHKCDVDRMAAAAKAWPGGCFVFAYNAPWMEIRGCDGYGRPGYGPVTSAGSTTETQIVPETYYDQLTRQQFEDGMAPKSVPAGVPEVMPVPVQWPIEKPILNPSEVNPANPDAVPTSRPLRIPEGDPVLVPDSNPPAYKSPVIDVVASPTVQDPWRVDVQPKDISSTSPEPLTISTVPVSPPSGETSQEAPPGLCEEYPDIIACQKVELGELDPSTIPDRTVNVAITPQGGFGADSAACPAPRTFTARGRTYTLSFQPICDYAAALRPLVIAFAWLSAAIMVIGAGRKI